MGQAESNESAAVKRQAEGGAVPMYELLDLGGKQNTLFEIFILCPKNQLCYPEKIVDFLGVKNS